eukprot:gene3340-2322_t
MQTRNITLTQTLPATNSNTLPTNCKSHLKIKNTSHHDSKLKQPINIPIEKFKHNKHHQAVAATISNESYTTNPPNQPDIPRTHIPLAPIINTTNLTNSNIHIKSCTTTDISLKLTVRKSTRTIITHNYHLHQSSHNQTLRISITLKMHSLYYKTMGIRTHAIQQPQTQQQSITNMIYKPPTQRVEPGRKNTRTVRFQQPFANHVQKNACIQHPTIAINNPQTKLTPLPPRIHCVNPRKLALKFHLATSFQPNHTMNKPKSKFPTQHYTINQTHQSYNPNETNNKPQPLRIPILTSRANQSNPTSHSLLTPNLIVSHTKHTQNKILSEVTPTKYNHASMPSYPQEPIPSTTEAPALPQPPITHSKHPMKSSNLPTACMLKQLTQLIKSINAQHCAYRCKQEAQTTISLTNQPANNPIQSMKVISQFSIHTSSYRNISNLMPFQPQTTNPASDTYYKNLTVNLLQQSSQFTHSPDQTAPTNSATSRHHTLQSQTPLKPHFPPTRQNPYSPKFSRNINQHIITTKYNNPNGSFTQQPHSSPSQSIPGGIPTGNSKYGKPKTYIPNLQKQLNLTKSAAQNPPTATSIALHHPNITLRVNSPSFTDPQYYKDQPANTQKTSWKTLIQKTQKASKTLAVNPSANNQPAHCPKITHYGSQHQPLTQTAALANTKVPIRLQAEITTAWLTPKAASWKLLAGSLTWRYPTSPDYQFAKHNVTPPSNIALATQQVMPTTKTTPRYNLKHQSNRKLAKQPAPPQNLARAVHPTSTQHTEHIRQTHHQTSTYTMHTQVQTIGQQTNLNYQTT